LRKAPTPLERKAAAMWFVEEEVRHNRSEASRTDFERYVDRIIEDDFNQWIARRRRH